MATEIQYIPTKHQCKKTMLLKIEKIDDEDCWMLYGICKKCKVVVCMALFMQKNKPIPKIDYILEDKCCEDDKEMQTKEEFFAEEQKENATSIIN